MKNESSKHTWRFFRAGGFDQVQLDEGDDLKALDQLDQKLWVALACPTQGIELDEKTLEMIDTDKDGRIRAPEILAAVKWACTVLKDPAILVKGGETLPLAAIDAGNDEGKRLYTSAKRILRSLDKKSATEISLGDTADTAKILGGMTFNGDGVITVANAGSDAALGQVIGEVIDLLGGEADRSGALGTTQEKVDKVFAEAEAYAAWWKAAEGDAASVLPLGDGTAAAAESCRAVAAKVEDFFTRVGFAAFDTRAAAPMNHDPAEYAALAGKLLTAKTEDLAAFPLARIEANRSLPLTTGLNPAWAAAMRKFATEVVTPLLGERSELSERDWAELTAKLAPFEAWRGAKAGVLVEKLGIARVRAILDGGLKARVDDLIVKDRAVEPEINAIASVERLIRYHRDLFLLLENFVSFRQFYGRNEATFQIGKLYLDGRSCDFCIRVNDAAAHATLASLGGIYLVYCDLSRKGTGEKMTIAAAFTAGDTDALRVGRNGLFYDRKGNDWDATIISIVEHPISVPQAFWLPYKRAGKLIGEQIDKLAASRDKAAQDKAAAGVGDAGAAVETGKPAEAKPAVAFDVARFAGIFAAIGLAIGAIGSALVAVGTGFVALAWWQMPLVLVGGILAISLPSMFIAYLKLRRRNIGPLLDANGWAVNARAKINIPFGATLTAVATLPPNARRSLDDPYAEKRRPWLLYAFLLLLVAAAYCWRTGRLETWLHALQAPPPAAAPAASGSAK